MTNNNIEIIGITTVGTYPSWIDRTVASMYNKVDKIIVVNAGYDIYNSDNPYYRLEKEHKLLQELDIQNKILEYTPHGKELFIDNFEEEKDELGRASNMTLSTILANESFTSSKQHWILKLDSDQIFYQFERQSLEELIKKYPKKKTHGLIAIWLNTIALLLPLVFLIFFTGWI